MNFKINCIILFIFVSALFVPAQTSGVSPGVAITSEKVTYTRKTDDPRSFKKTFVVNYPRFSGIYDPRAKKRLMDSIDYWKNFETTLKENIEENTWLDNLDHAVFYNNGAILSIKLMMDGSGAYPDSMSKYIVVNLKTGKRIYLSEVFNDVSALLVRIDQEQKKELARAEANLKNQGERSVAKELMLHAKGASYRTNKLEDFSVDESGVAFYYDYGFPHAIKAIEPPGIYKFSWAELRDFVKRDGLFGKFVND